MGRNRELVLSAVGQAGGFPVVLRPKITGSAEDQDQDRRQTMDWKTTGVVLAVLAGWFLLQLWVLPRLGVPT